jgi:ApaG protein
MTDRLGCQPAAHRPWTSLRAVTIVGRKSAAPDGVLPRDRDRGQTMYQERTRSIQISVEPFYVDDQSAPEQNRFVFGYRVQIDNQGAETVQLISRQWRITDSLGRTMEVRGAGVVGKQPILRPGESFEYTSGTPLPTPSGIMVGSYQMVTAAGERFEVAIPAFSLDAPGRPSKLH